MYNTTDAHSTGSSYTTFGTGAGNDGSTRVVGPNEGLGGGALVWDNLPNYKMLVGPTIGGKRNELYYCFNKEKVND